MNKKLLLSAVTTIALTGAAHAATFTLVGGNADVIPESGQTNDVLTNVFQQDGAKGFFGSQIEIDGDAMITVSYWGYEAGFSNGFSITGETSATDATAKTVRFATIPATPTTPAPGFQYAANASTPITFDSLYATDGLLDFAFTSVQGGDAVNGSNTDNTATNPSIANFFTTISDDAKTVFLFFDDTGAGDDDNHDDFVVSLNIGVGPGGQTPTPVPLPAGGLLLLGGLGAFAMTRRRKDKS